MLVFGKIMLCIRILHGAIQTTLYLDLHISTCKYSMMHWWGHRLHSQCDFLYVRMNLLFVVFIIARLCGVWFFFHLFWDCFHSNCVVPIPALDIRVAKCVKCSLPRISMICIWWMENRMVSIDASSNNRGEIYVLTHGSWCTRCGTTLNICARNCRWIGRPNGFNEYSFLERSLTERSHCDLTVSCRRIHDTLSATVIVFDTLMFCESINEVFAASEKFSLSRSLSLRIGHKSE